MNREKIFSDLVEAVKLGMALKNEYADTTMYVFKNNYSTIGHARVNSDDKEDVLKAVKKAITPDFCAVGGYFTISAAEHKSESIEEAKKTAEELVKNIKEQIKSGDKVDDIFAKMGIETITVLFLWERTGEILVKGLKFVSSIDEDGDVLRIPTEFMIEDSLETSVKLVKAWTGIDFFDGKDSGSSAIVIEKSVD